MANGLMSRISGAFNSYADAVDNQFEDARTALDLDEPLKLGAHLAAAYAGTATLVPIVLAEAVIAGVVGLVRPGK